MSATGRGTIREDRDFYPTPERAFKILLPYLDKTLFHWEPACGDRRLIAWMREAGIESDGNDIVNGYDFLTDYSIREGQCVITNPPYTKDIQFCIKALESRATEIFLLYRINFLGAQYRKAWWQSHEPSALFVLSERPSFRKKGGTDATEYAWYYWGNRYKGIFHP